LLIARIK